MLMRILIGDMPRMMCAIVDSAIESQADMANLGQYRNRELEAAICAHHANVVILSENGSSSIDFHRELLLMYPQLKVVVMTDGGRGASLFELRHLKLVEPSPVALLDAIRASVDHGPGAARDRDMVTSQATASAHFRSATSQPGAKAPNRKGRKQWP